MIHLLTSNIENYEHALQFISKLKIKEIQISKEVRNLIAKTLKGKVYKL